MTRRLEIARRGVTLTLAATLAVACSRPSPPTERAGDAPADSMLALVNRVWKVSKSSGVEPGALYVFLSDGTLLIASSHGTPALGRWKFGSDTLTLVEEGIPHRANVLKLTAGELSISLSDHGTPLDITFTPGGVP